MSPSSISVGTCADAAELRGGGRVMPSGCTRSDPLWRCCGANCTSPMRCSGCTRRCWVACARRWRGIAFAPLARRLPRAALVGYLGRSRHRWRRAVRHLPQHRHHDARRRAARIRRHDPAHLLSGDPVRAARRTPRPCADRGQRRRGCLRRACTAPLGPLQDTPVGWRAAMGLPAVLSPCSTLRYRHQPLRPAPIARLAGRARLPLFCWLLATLVAVGIAVEFCPWTSVPNCLPPTACAPARPLPP